MNQIFGKIGTQRPVLLVVVVVVVVVVVDVVVVVAVVVVVVVLLIIYQMLDCRGARTAHVFQIVNFEMEKTREKVTLLHSFCILHDSWWNEGVYSVPQFLIVNSAFIQRNIERVVVVFQLFFTGGLNDKDTE